MDEWIKDALKECRRLGFLNEKGLNEYVGLLERELEGGA